MIPDILTAFRFRGTLRRVPFALAFLGLSVAMSAVSWGLRQQLIREAATETTYVEIAWGTQVSIAVLAVPLCAARLRDIGWSVFLSPLILLSPFLSSSFLVLLASRQGGTLTAPPWVPNALSVLILLVLAWIVVLLFKRGAGTESQS